MAKDNKITERMKKVREFIKKLTIEGKICVIQIACILLGIIIRYIIPLTYKNVLGEAVGVEVFAEISLVIFICVTLVGWIGGLIFIGIYCWRKNFICPECGAIREEHKQCLETKVNTYSQTTSDGRVDRIPMAATRTTYKYRYKYTYVCPDCGEKLEKISWESGGWVLKYIDGFTIDKVKPVVNK